MNWIEWLIKQSELSRAGWEITKAYPWETAIVCIAAVVFALMLICTVYTIDSLINRRK